MRIGAKPARGIGYTDLVEQTSRFGKGRAAVHAAMKPQGLDDLIAHRVHRIKRTRRVLGDDSDLPAAHLVEARGWRMEQLLSGQAYAARYVSTPCQQTERCKPCHGFAATAFADHAQRFATPESEIESAQRRHTVERDTQTCDLKKRLHARSLPFPHHRGCISSV